MEALVFSIYYAATISMTPGQFELYIGEKRLSVLERYRFATEQALAQADFLNTPSMLLLQAAVLFLTARRGEDP